MELCEIDICVEWNSDEIEAESIRAALRHALTVEGVASAVLSVTVVDNTTIHAINRDHLQHDFPTDVISFGLDWMHSEKDGPGFEPTSRSSGASIEGEIVIGGEYAFEAAQMANWSLQNELTLYAVHGMLHICGYDDLSPHEKQMMRSREKSILSGLGLTPEYPDDEPSGSPSSATGNERSVPEDSE